MARKKKKPTNLAQAAAELQKAHGRLQTAKGDVGESEDKQGYTRIREQQKLRKANLTLRRSQNKTAAAVKKAVTPPKEMTYEEVKRSPVYQRQSRIKKPKRGVF